MPRFLYLLPLLMSFTAQARPAVGIPRWDALPAIEVHHLLGPDAGRDVCPMCQYGYDAGVLVFLPSDLPLPTVRQVAATLVAVAPVDPRFRVFVLVTGKSPSSALLTTLTQDSPTWFVAHLDETSLPGAERDFRRPLAGRTHGFVFAQRRLLLAFDPGQPLATWRPALARTAIYARRFLDTAYAQSVVASNPDTPKGRLWAAPDRLSSVVAFAGESRGALIPVCPIDVTRVRRPDALVALTPAAGPDAARTRWAKTDASGCLQVRGTRDAGAIRVDVFSVLQAPITVRASREVIDGQSTDLSMSGEPRLLTGREPIVGLPCEGCEGVFQKLPTSFSATARITPANEPGQRLTVSGVVSAADGRPQSGVIVYAYQTDAAGHYPRDTGLTGDGARHGRLRQWARTDAAGRYTFLTVRPGAYPGRDLPQHIHLHVIEPGRCTYYLGDVLFDDDPKLTAEFRARETAARGGSGIARPDGDAQRGWTITRNIRLGLNVPGYAACAH